MHGFTTKRTVCVRMFIFLFKLHVVFGLAPNNDVNASFSLLS